MSSVYSWELFDRFYQIVHNLDLGKGYYLVEICTRNFPRDPDSIPIIILQSIEEECREIKHKLFLQLLIEYYFHLINLEE